MARPARPCKGFLRRSPARRSGPPERGAAAQGWHFARIAAILVLAATPAGRSAGVAAQSSSPTHAIQNRAAPALFMLTMAVNYLYEAVSAVPGDQPLRRGGRAVNGSRL
jgi:hypothetical protein